MVNRNLMRQFDLSDPEMQEQFQAALRDESTGAELDIHGVITADPREFGLRRRRLHEAGGDEGHEGEEGGPTPPNRPRPRCAARMDAAFRARATLRRPARP